MLKRQVWMSDDDEFDHMVKNSQRVLRLINKYKNHPYIEAFTKECNVMFVYGTYVLEGEADAKFSLDDIWKLLQEDLLPNNARNFCSQMISCMRAWDYQQKASDLLLSTEIIKKTHKIMIEDEKDVLWGNIESHLYLQAINITSTSWSYWKIHERRTFLVSWSQKRQSIYGRYKFVWKHYQYPSIWRWEW